jgi:hypothetical protein
MSADIYRFEFDPSVPLPEAEATLQLALIAAEGLLGESRVRLDATYHVAPALRQITVDATTDAGSAVVRMFSGFLMREFGSTAFRVQRERAMAAVA